MWTQIKKFIKISLPFIFNAGYGFLVFYIFPSLLLLAFNRTKGAVNNPDGKIFVPIALFLIILIPVLFFLINKVIIKKLFSDKKVLIIFVFAFIIGAAIAIVKTNATYSINYTNILKELAF